MSRRLPREVRRELYERGAKPSLLAELGVTQATVHNWVKR
jgi:hypothetical protein